ncbi:MAG: hypothetical protein GY771_14940 [bacterium]|nr:hypothetical protein [bacterium]
MKYVILTAVLSFFGTYVIALEVGDNQPGLDGYSIDDVGPDYHGPWLDIQDYLDDGKCIVVVHWKLS